MGESVPDFRAYNDALRDRDELAELVRPTASDFRRCLQCMSPVDAADGFFELTRQPQGDLYTLCSLPCLTKFVRGSSD